MRSRKWRTSQDTLLNLPCVDCRTEGRTEGTGRETSNRESSSLTLVDLLYSVSTTLVRRDPRLFDLLEGEIGTGI